MTSPPADRTQGSLVAIGDPVLEEILKRYQYTPRDDARWIITTHECCYESEQVTSLEVMPATYTDEEPNSWIQTGQSARQIALPFKDGWLLVEPDRRVVLRRKKRQRDKIGRESFLDDTRFEIFKNWLGHRYSRPALPDKVSEFLSNRGINKGMAALLPELREIYRILITGHEDADEPGAEANIGISLVILLDGSELTGEPHDSRREAWLDKVRDLNWAISDGHEVGVALDQIEFVSARDMSIAEFAQYDIVDFEFMSNAYALEDGEHDHTDHARGISLGRFLTAVRRLLPW